MQRFPNSSIHKIQTSKKSGTPVFGLFHLEKYIKDHRGLWKHTVHDTSDYRKHSNKFKDEFVKWFLPISVYMMDIAQF